MATAPMLTARARPYGHRHPRRSRRGKAASAIQHPAPAITPAAAIAAGKDGDVMSVVGVGQFSLKTSRNTTPHTHSQRSMGSSPRPAPPLAWESLSELA
eukprot:scaffold14367_cov129-Isochrysis_galbana.AAC.1